MQATRCVLLWTLFTIAQIDARPQELGVPEVTRGNVANKDEIDDARKNLTTKAEDVRSRNDPTTERDLKGLAQMNQSIRTMTTQLLNVSTDTLKEQNKTADMKTSDIESKLNLLIKKSENVVKDITSSRENLNKKPNEYSTDVHTSYRRPGNSKFSHFEISHPGHAMAITEDELERELASSRVSTNKNPTTPGGISTWILLNPPSTTSKPLDVNNYNNRPIEIKSTWTMSKSTPATMKIEATLKADLKATHATFYHDSGDFSTVKMEKSTSAVPQNTTPRLDAVENDKTKSYVLSDNPTSFIYNVDDKEVTATKMLTKKSSSSNRENTIRSTFTTPKSTTVISKTTTMKVIQPNHFSRPQKPSVVRKSTTVKPDSIKAIVNATSKIEKVTFRPIQTISPSESDKQIFISKIQASVKTNPYNELGIKENNLSPSDSSIIVSSKKNNLPINHTLPNGNVHIVGKVKPVKSNLKVQSPKPIDNSQTTIKIEPIPVNTPVLTIKKIEDRKKESKTSSNNSNALESTDVDDKFQVNSELTNTVETSSEPTTTLTISSSTTKRPKLTKRKKNKIRRRKPSSTTLNPTTLVTTAITSSTESHEERITETDVVDSSIQESKIVSDTNISTNSTKNKKKQAPKIGTQIYQFLSREVMPSVGVMSLVGLGLGIASYFFYPFGGAIARRNYDVEPNYKYNLNEYAGNYGGQSEEEVLSKVFQGMNTDNKYGGMKDYEKNYYRYQPYDGNRYTDNTYTTKKNIPPGYPTSSVPVYKHHDNTQVFYDSYHRNNDFPVYSDMSTTPKYYDRQTKMQFLNNQVNGDRQFVIENISPEYPYENINNNDNTNVNINNNQNNGNIDINNRRYNNDNNNNNMGLIELLTSTTTESIQTDFEKQIAQNLQFVKNPVNIQGNIAQTEALALKANNGYDEIEITPTAVAVEHGPRSLKLEKLDISNVNNNENKNNSNSKNNDVKIRTKRESSVIQQIPSRREIARDEKEEDLSNEILDIIDSAISTEFPMTLTNEKKYQVKLENKKDKNQINEIENETKIKLPYDEQTTMIDLIFNAVNKESDVEDEKKFTNGENNSSTILSTTPTIMMKKPSLFEANNTNATQLNNNVNDTNVNLGEKVFNGTKISITPPKPIGQEKFNIFNFVKTLAEIKLKLGLTILKHASENFAKYLGNVQKRLNGE